MDTTTLEVVATKFGKLGLTHTNNKLVKVEYLNNSAQLTAELSVFAQKFNNQLQQYLSNPQHKFALELALNGTSFQKKVWQALQQIPVRSTITYGELAAKLASNPRAVGNACRQNPLPIVIPCHRVVGKNGMGGYAGQTEGKLFAIKEALLKLESKVSSIISYQVPDKK